MAPNDLAGAARANYRESLVRLRRRVQGPDGAAVTEPQSPRPPVIIPGDVLAEFARANAAAAPKDPLTVASSARNRFAGLVTKVVTDKVMAQVEMQCGPFTVVSLMSADAVRELGLEPGSVAVAVVKATTVIVETTGGQS